MKNVYINGTVITMNPLSPVAEALVTDGDRIIAIGAGPEMIKKAGEPYKSIDMQGGFLFPGFNETHNHLSMTALYKTYAYLGDCETINDVTRKMTQHAKAYKGDVIVGYGYDDTLLKDGRGITRHDLDIISQDKPVLIIHISSHFGYLNSVGLTHFSITTSTKDPEGGFIHREPDGQPAGRIDENAYFALSPLLKKPTADQFYSLMKETMQEYNSKGITAVHDAGLGLEGMPDTVMSTYERLHAEDELNVRVFLSALPEEIEKLSPEPGQKMDDQKIVLGGVKLFIDGSIQGETAALIEDYSSRPGWSGELLAEIEEFEQLVARFHSEGHHLSIHGNGDRAIETIITAIEKAQQQFPRDDCRHMLIHAQMSHRSHLLRMRKAGIIPSFFAMHVENWGDRHRDIFIGPKRAARIDPAGEAEAMGLPFTLHVDTPILPIQVITSIHTAVNRVTRNGKQLGPDQKITPYGAVAAYTSVAAYCSHSEKYRGTLEIDKLADMVLLSQDPTSVDPGTMRDTRVMMTVVGGRTVYEQLN